MKFLVGSYDQNIYEVTINEKTKTFKESSIVNDAFKPSYIIPFKDSLAYIHMKDNNQYLKIKEEDISLGNDTSCHLSYDQKNELIYSSHYQSGSLFVLSKSKKDEWSLLNKYTYQENSHIHYANFIPTIDLLGVCDLGDNTFYLYTVKNKKLALQTSFKFEPKTGPRHFVYHKSLPLIYIVCEHSGEVITLEYNDLKLTVIQSVSLLKGASAAIRITKNSTHLYASDRLSNTISSFEIIEDGLLIPLQTISTFGDHPRDFNLSNDERYLVVANMNSSDLSLYERDLESGSLILLDKGYPLTKGSTVVFI